MATNTARWGLRKPAAADTVSVALDLAGPYDIIDGALGSTVCTSTTRPGAPVQGQTIYETDTRRIHVWSGTVWLPVGPITAVKTTAHTKNASIALTDDTQLTLPVLASTTYQVEAALIYSGTAVADAKFGLTVPTGATWQLAPQALLVATAATSGDLQMAVSTASGIALGANGAGVKLLADVTGALVVGTTAGNAAISWAQNTSEASDTILHIGSWLRLTRI